MPRRIWSTLLALALAWVSLPAATQAAAPDLRFEPILAGYDRPIAVVSPRGTRNVIYVVEQSGRVKRARLRDGTWRKAGVLLDIQNRVTDPEENLEHGLLGLAFHPDYRKNGRFYVSYTRGPGAPNLKSVVAEYRRGPRGRAPAASERVLMVVRQRSDVHNISHLGFGRDGMLYIASGDDHDGIGARALDNRYGKIMRIDPTDPDGAGPRRYRIPRTNPYVGRYGLDPIWSSGLRNPWAFSFDRKNGNLWLADVGQGLREEVNRAAADRSGLAGRGDEYAWDACQGSLEFNDDEGDPDSDCDQGRLPIYEYPHDDAHCAVIGGHVLRGGIHKGWRGLYVGADWCGTAFVLDQRGRELLTKPIDRGFVAIGRDTAGRLFAVHRDSGTIHRLHTLGADPRS